MSYTIENLCTLANVKLLLNIQDTTQDSVLTLLITQASAAITHYCNRPFWLSTNAGNPFTELYSGNNDELLVLNYWPVQAVANVWENDIAYWQTANFTSDDLLTAGTDYALQVDTPSGASQSGILMRINDYWLAQYNIPTDMLMPIKASGYGNIQVEYTYGYTAIPDDLAFAAQMVVIRMYNAAGFGVTPKSEGDQGYSYSLGGGTTNDWQGILGGDVQAIIAKYRIVGVPSWA